MSPAFVVHPMSDNPMLYLGEELFDPRRGTMCRRSPDPWSQRRCRHPLAQHQHHQRQPRAHQGFHPHHVHRSPVEHEAPAFNPLVHILGGLARAFFGGEASRPDFEVRVDARGYGPEEVKVQVKPESRLLTVSGRHEEEVEEEGGSSVIQFQRTFKIPEEFDLEAVESKMLTEEGVLLVKAPPKKQEVEKEAKEDDNKTLEEDLEQIETEASEAKKQKVDEVETDNENEGEKELTFSVDVSGYEPKDLSLSFDEAGRVLTLVARHEEGEEDEDEDGESSICSSFVKEFSRSFVIPEEFDQDALKSNLGKDGKLRICAPRKSAKSSEPQSVPISMDLD